MPNLADLPLPLAILVATFWLITQIYAEFTKSQTSLVAAFSEKYNALLTSFAEDRAEARQRWVERDRQLIETLTNVTIAKEKMAYEVHALRNMVTPLVLSVDAQQHKAAGDKPGDSGAGNPHAAD